MTVKMILNNASTITLGLLSSYLQKLLHLLIPSKDLYAFVLAEIYKPADFKHVVFGLQTVGDDVRPKRNQFNPLELTAYLPTDVVHPKLQSLGTVQYQQHSQTMELLVNTLLYHAKLL
jgi:hypothetical protein